MRLSVFAFLPLLSFGAMIPAADACDGRAEVEAAFVKQHEKPWRTRILSTSDAGVPQEQVYDYQPPDRMHRTVVVGDQKVETIGVGRWAWTADGGAWQELDAPYARVVVTHMHATLAPPKASADFTCLGEVAYEGKTYLGYQTTPEKMDDGKMIARTIYVDPETGLPAFNIIGAPDGSGEPLMKEEHSYPDGINIIPPVAKPDFSPEP